MRGWCSERTTRGQEVLTTRGQEGGKTRGHATTSLHKTTRGRCSERMTRDVGSINNVCSEDSNSDGDGEGGNGNGDSGDDNSKSKSGGSDSNSGRKNNNQLKPAAEKAPTAVDAALASILLAS
jgi:hypothetical protein